jgi:hypothetical protein
MTAQLPLIDGPTGPWHLDDRTRAVGRRGVAQARSALQAARARALAAETDPVPNAAAETGDGVADAGLAAGPLRAVRGVVAGTEHHHDAGLRGTSAARRALADARRATCHADAA